MCGGEQGGGGQTFEGVGVQGGVCEGCYDGVYVFIDVPLDISTFYVTEEIRGEGGGEGRISVCV